MQPSGGVHYPFKLELENDCLKRTHTVEGTVLSAVRMFLLTRRGSRLGNMIGSIVPELLFELINPSNLSGMSTEILSELNNQFPGVSFINVNLEFIRGRFVELNIKITLSIPGVESLSQLELSLPTIFSNETLAQFGYEDL